MGLIRVLNQRGDEPIEWNPEDEASTTHAREEFERLKGEGYEFFQVAEAKGDRVTEFDPSLGKLIASPGVQTQEDKESGERPKAMAGGPNSFIAA